MPSELTLAAAIGRTTGSRSSNRLRTEGHIPGVVYGHGADPLSVTVERRELRHALSTPAGMNALINLTVGGDNFLTIVRDLQRHPVKRTVIHVDFLRISRDEELEIAVPIHLEGEADEVTKNEGIIEAALDHLVVRAKPGDIPANIPVDISQLTIGDVIRVGDLPLPAGVVTDVDPETLVVIATITRAAEAEAAAEEGEGEGGAEGEGGHAEEAGE